MLALAPALIAQQPAPQGPGIDLFVLVAAMFAVMYFVVLRPQRKEQLQYQEMLKNLAKHDEILTSGGLIGKIVALDEDRLVVKVDEKTDTRVTLHRAYVSKVLRKHGMPAGEESKS